MNFQRGGDPKEALRIGRTVKAKMHHDKHIYELPMWLWNKLNRFHKMSDHIARELGKCESLHSWAERDDMKELYKQMHSLADEIKEDGQEYGYYKEWVRTPWILIKEK